MKTPHRDSIITIEYESIIIDRDKFDAILFMIDEEEVWLPRSEIEVDRENNEIQLPRWLAARKELG